jgi:TetR/AcrR family transcriptional regulator, transcriptional repressor of bet genes
MTSEQTPHGGAAPSRPERRRREVADAARRVIMRNGLGPTTLRDISREGGFTTGVLSHYFPDKQAVIVGAFLAASEDFENHVRDRLSAARSPAETLTALVRLAVPDHPGREGEWRLWSEMWTYAGGDPAFAAQIAETDGRWEALLRGVLANLRTAGLVRADVEPAAQAPVLARLVDGLGIRAWLTGDWESARRNFISYLGLLGIPPDLLAAVTPYPQEAE